VLLERVVHHDRVTDCDARRRTAVISLRFSDDPLVASPPEAWILCAIIVRLACKGGGSIERAADRQAAALKHVGVDHGGANIFVPQKFLHGTDVVPILEQVGRKTMTKGVTTDAFRDARPLGGANRQEICVEI